MSAALIGLQQASVHFGELPALQAIDLQIHRGDRIALVGANGAGKTTLLRLLNGLQRPSAGQRVLHAAADGRRPVTAMLFQRPFLLHFSVRRNLQLALWLADVPADGRADRLDQALARVGLQALADRPARSLSGGQQQRLAQRVIYLDGGRLVADLGVDDFFRRQDLPPEVAQFLKGELPWT